jgi:signal peptidase I
MAEAAQKNRTPAWLKFALIFIAVAFTAMMILFRANWHFYSIAAGSMEPTLRVGDYLAARNGPFEADEISRGEVIVYLQAGGNIPFISRLIGKGGDRIQMIGGMVYLNGDALKIASLDDYELHEPGGRVSSVRRFEETLDGKRYETLDIRNDSGGDNTKAFDIPEGHVFVLGDNRDNSNDSRFGAGFIPLDRIIGKARTIYWSPARDSPFGPIPVR